MPVPAAETAHMTSEYDGMLKVAEMCILCRCGCCKDECPMYSEILEESISPKGRNQLVHALLTGLLEPDERAVRIAYSCLLCKRDEYSCTAELRNAEATETLREYLLSVGMPLLPEHQLLVKSLENYGNPWQEPRSSRKRWAKGLKDKKVVPGKTETLFYVGCTFSLDRTLLDSPRALAHLLECAGEDFGLLLEDELCCGSTVKRLGHVQLFQKLRRENEQRIRATGVRRIVTACAGCYKTLSQDYKGLSQDVKVLHSTEYLAELVGSGRLTFKGADIKVTYHDPCHLGRHAEVYDAPRTLLHSVSGLELVEMKTSRELARCCGGGAGVKTAYPEISQKAAVRRIREAEKTGASALVTACPFCMQSLKDAAQSVGSSIDVVELCVFLDRYVECPKEDQR
ncbi:MAG: (Fe-S)-binding protein [Candidatus Thermoplasmatota archaeon]|nr:(Fe-S)-binding protein [Candidatus Thermoplasmatota archaeon]